MKEAERRRLPSCTARMHCIAWRGRMGSAALSFFFFFFLFSSPPLPPSPALLACTHSQRTGVGPRLTTTRHPTLTCLLSVPPLSLLLLIFLLSPLLSSFAPDTTHSERKAVCIAWRRRIGGCIECICWSHDTTPGAWLLREDTIEVSVLTWIVVELKKQWWLALVNGK
ncbi:hypothetical protein IWZ01DRAFT_119550 [Phyllosticta capitalensis]